MTVIVVAHRLSTVRHADKIVFLSAGSVAAEGTFEEVRALSPEFSELVSLGQV
jgi:ABC-type multidrug transport system fused ATPase/permease subunit